MVEYKLNFSVYHLLWWAPHKLSQNKTRTIEKKPLHEIYSACNLHLLLVLKILMNRKCLHERIGYEAGIYPNGFGARIVQQNYNMVDNS